MTEIIRKPHALIALMILRITTFGVRSGMGISTTFGVMENYCSKVWTHEHEMFRTMTGCDL